MTWLEHKFINLLSARLRNFKRKSHNLYNFSCPFCGDSKQKSSKARGYFYERDARYWYHCHNCMYHSSFVNVLQQLDHTLYSDYLAENLVNKKEEIWHVPKVNFDTDFALKELRKLSKISQLSDNHPGKKYVVARRIPVVYHSLFRWCPNFMTWTNILKPNKFSEEALYYDEGRILIPFFDEKNTFFAYQGRAISDTEQRYIMLVLNYDIPAIFGLNTVDFNEDVFVFEGPIDSTFVKNSLAMGGGDISQLTKVADVDRYIIVYDNEPHSKETKKKINQAINYGYRVCIWSNTIKEKDVNEMVLRGEKDIEGVIRSNVYSGMKAKARLAMWESNHD